jgi:flavin reductase (DIM6/NTAB) family NADH-FMN oxidoreductase RutF
VVNAAPFSFFNVFSEDPALIILGVQHRAGAGGGFVPKDTSRNIAASGQFVVNLVDETIKDAMNLTAIDFPPELSEVPAAGLSLLPGVHVGVPRLAEAPFALECRRHTTIAFSSSREIVIGEVVHFHAREGLVDAARCHVVAERYRPVGRLFGSDYAHQDDRFSLTRETYAEWLAKHPAMPGGAEGKAVG